MLAGNLNLGRSYLITTVIDFNLIRQYQTLQFAGAYSQSKTATKKKLHFVQNS